MTNNDVLNKTQAEIANRIANAAREGNTEEFENAMGDMFQNINDSIMNSARSMQANADAAALAQRGVRQLTAAETEFYNNFAEAARAGGSNPLMALTGAQKTFPVTIIEQVMEDMQQAHPLMDAIDMQNTTGLTHLLVNADEGGNAAWGDITAEIEKELTSGFKDIELGQFKLSAFMPVDIAMLDLGPAWLDSYIRTCLSEALAIGYEMAIVSGTGKSSPIGMDRNVSEGVSVTGGVYPQKDATAVTDFEADTYGNLLSKIAQNEKGKARTVNGLILVVNPLDYYKSVMPGTTMLTPAGSYVNDVLPVPTQIIQSVGVKQGEAILGMGKKYFLGVGGNRGVQFSDDYKFTDDKRYYKVVAYGNGRPKDNNAFLRLDISGLKPKYLKTKQVTE